MNRRHFLATLAALVAAGFAPRTARGGIVPSARVRAALPPDSARGSADGDAAPAPPATVTLAVGGDTTLGYNLEAHFDQQLEAGVPKKWLYPLYFAGVKPILDAADIALVNLECPFTDRGEPLEKNFNFRARPELVRILQEGSVDLVTCANNHVADYGREGVADTIAMLEEAGIAHFGGGLTLAQARRPAILERHGLKIGFIGHYFQAAPDMKEPRGVLAARDRAGAAGCYLDRDCIRRMVTRDVRELVRQVDVAIPYFHWGHEGSYELRDYQVDLAHLCVDLGCKAVLGAHPHRVQAVEVYKGAPIFYSLANFVYGGIKEPSDRLSMIARLRVSRAGPVEADVVPINITRWPEAPFQPYLLEGEERRNAMGRIASLSKAVPATLPQLDPRLWPDVPGPAPADSSAGYG